MLYVHVNVNQCTVRLMCIISPLGLIIVINQSTSYVPNCVAMSVCMVDFLGICWSVSF